MQALRRGGAVLKIVVSFIRCCYYEYYLYFKQNVATTAWCNLNDHAVTLIHIDLKSDGFMTLLLVGCMNAHPSNWSVYPHVVWSTVEWSVQSMFNIALNTELCGYMIQCGAACKICRFPFIWCSFGDHHAVCLCAHIRTCPFELWNQAKKCKQ